MRRLRLPIWALSLIILAASATTVYALFATNVIGNILNGQNIRGDYTITAGPASQGVLPGITNAEVSVRSTNGFTSTVNLAVRVVQTGQNTPAATLNRTSVTPTANGSATVNLAIDTTNIVVTAPTGYPTFNITVTGTSGRLSHSASLSVTMLDPQRCTPGFICPSTTDPLTISVTKSTSDVNMIQVNNHATFPINIPLIYYTDSYKVEIGGDYTINKLVDPNTVGIFFAPELNVSKGGLVLLWQSPPPPPTLTTHQQLNQSWTSTSQPPGEFLSFESYTLNSGTNATIYIRNTGLIPVTFTSYTAKDPSGDTYTLNPWNGPTINPTVLVNVNITIGPSCPSCTLSGNPFTFTWPDPVTIATARGNTFTFDV